ncbi:MAG: bifunctional DNA-formamidopyrimidine glycosylase/DNA-(apurinic or apyrimidinic site) lyase, partial [bacterium]
MPELPEVETVRAGLEAFVLGRRIERVEVLHPRAVRRHGAGAADFEQRLASRTVAAVRRRGKYLWLPLTEPLPAATPLAGVMPTTGGPAGDSRNDETAGAPALVAHLGMSGQLLVQDADSPDPVHLRARMSFADRGPQLRFVDQRTFGGLILDELVTATDQPDQAVPRLIAHIARDPLDPAFDDREFSRRLRRSVSVVKRTLLDQSVISGVGNIYADESLWRARLHGRRPGAALRPRAVADLLAQVRAVLGAALRAGGTSFDALYVNVNGQSGYF